MRLASRKTGEVEFFARTPEFEPLKGLQSPKSDSAALLQHTNTMPLYYLFGLGEIEPSSFGKAVFLVALWLFLASLLGTLIVSSIILLILIKNDRARGNAGPGVGAQDAEEDGVVGGPLPRLLIHRFGPVE